MGRSRYWELELTSRWLVGGHEMNFTYVRSRSKGDLNVFNEYFGNFRNPIIRPNQFSVTETDTRHRFLFRGAFAVQKWTVSPVFEARQGFPYSLVDQDLNFVGMRNEGGRFPNVWVLDLGIQRPDTNLRVQHMGRCAHVSPIRERPPKGRASEYRCPRPSGSSPIRWRGRSG